MLKLECTEFPFIRVKKTEKSGEVEVRPGDLPDVKKPHGTTLLHERSESKLPISTTRSVNNFLKNEVKMMEWNKKSGEWAAPTFFRPSRFLFKT